VIAARAIVPWLAAIGLGVVGGIALWPTDDGDTARRLRALEASRDAELARMHAELGRMQAELALVQQQLDDARPTMSVRRALANHRPGFDACIHDFLVEHPMPRNRSVILGRLDDTGRLVDLNVSVAAGGYKTAEACVADVLRTIVVPERNHDVILGITYEVGQPLSFGVTYRDGDR